MKHVDEYRDGDTCRRLVESIRRSATRQWKIMEVCGGQTHGILRWGLDRQLQGSVELLHGPGCPVCVTPAESIDAAIDLARRPNVVLTSFGDMLRVPGSGVSLMQARAAGGNVRLVYSPLDAVAIARENPAQEVVFFAVGFETTSPATALAVKQAAELQLANFSLLVAHVRVQPAMELIAAEVDRKVDGFLAAGHVCTVAGFSSYETLVTGHRIPVVVTGFEPVDLLSGIARCVALLERGQAASENCYERCVSPQGNTQAQNVVNEVFEVCDASWRGLNTIVDGGLRLRERYARFDAARKFAITAAVAAKDCECRSGEVLAGRIKPPQCEWFAVRCTPTTPLGAPMVSAEGACAAYFRYSPRPAGTNRDSRA